VVLEMTLAEKLFNLFKKQRSESDRVEKHAALLVYFMETHI